MAHTGPQAVRTRRQALAFILGAPFAATLGRCQTYGAANPPLSGELLGQTMALGHRLRTAPPGDDVFARLRPQRHDILIVGAGPAGLSAGYHLQRNGLHDFAVLELEETAGGTSRGGASTVTPYPWAAHYITCPRTDNHPLCALLQNMGVITMDPKNGQPRGEAPYLVAEPKERHFYKGFFYPGLYRYAGASAADLTQLARFQTLVARYGDLRDGAGRRAFTLPRTASSDDAELAALDQIPAQEFLRAQGLRSERLLWLLNYACRDDFGLELAQTSAWALVHYFASRSGGPDDGSGAVLTWPNGNGALIEHLSRGFTDRIHTGKLVVDIINHSRYAAVHVIDGKTGKAERHLARRVITATPQLVTARVVRDLRQGARPAPELRYGAWLVANLHLTGRPDQRGAEQAWDTVLVDSPSLGYVAATHQRGRAFGPTVWTYYLPMTDADPAQGRRRLLEPDLHDFQDAVLADLSRAHPDLRRHVQRIDVFRWGHGMVQPRVGTLFEPRLVAAARPLGRVHFAHSDLSGLSLFEEAFAHGLRAADEVLATRNETPA